MHRYPGWIAALAALIDIAALGGTATAQTARTGGSASAQLMQQMQQLASERTALQAENDKLKTQLAEVSKDRDALKTGQQAMQHRSQDAAAALAHSNTERQTAEQELAQNRAKMQELIAKFRETIVALRAAETEDSSIKQTLATRERELTSCAEHNVALYHLNDEILTHYEQQSAFARFSEIESFTRIKRTQNENLIDDYRGRAQDQRVAPPKVMPAPTTAAPAAGAQVAPAVPPPTAATPAASAKPSGGAAAATPAVATPAAQPQAATVPVTDAPAPR